MGNNVNKNAPVIDIPILQFTEVSIVHGDMSWGYTVGADKQLLQELICENVVTFKSKPKAVANGDETFDFKLTYVVAGQGDTVINVSKHYIEVVKYKGEDLKENEKWRAKPVDAKKMKEGLLTAFHDELEVRKPSTKKQGDFVDKFAQHG